MQNRSILRSWRNRELKLTADAGALLTPHWIELTLIGVSVALSALAYFGDKFLIDFANLTAPTLLSLAMGWGAIMMLRQSATAIWLPLFWFRLAYMTYAGVGSLVPYIANDTTRDYIDSYYALFPRDISKYNLIMSFFALLTLIVIRLINNFINIQRRKKGHDLWKPSPSSLSLYLIGASFMIIGLIFFFLMLPYRFYTSNQVVPSIYNVGYGLLTISYFLFGYWALKEKSLLIILIILICLIDSFTGLLQFAKFGILLPLIVLGIAFLYHRPTLGRLMMFCSAIAAVYFASGPLIGYSRSVAINTYGAAATVSAEERLEILLSYASASSISATEDDIQVGWSRLSYVNAGSFAINRYDSGLPGDSLRYLGVVWIPRIIYPDKPEITKISGEFNFLVNGNDQSASNPGIPVEGYWNYGWPGLFVFALVMGIILLLWSRYSLAVLSNESWHLLFVVFFGMRLGFRVDGLLVSDIIGPLATAVILHIVLTFANYLVARVGARASPVAIA